MVYVSGPAPSIPANDPTFCTVGGTTTNLVFEWDRIPLGSAPSVIQFTARLVTSPAVNTANVAWTSLPIDPQPTGPGGALEAVKMSAFNDASTERWYDPLDAVNLNVYGSSSSITINPGGVGGGGGGGGGRGSTTDDPADLPKTLPATGFAPNKITLLPEQPKELAYRATDVWLEVPRLGLKMPIVGVPLYEKDWDISWLWKEAGWLEGTAFPSWQGNSVLTSHVTLPNGEAGPFASLGKLQWGDRILVHAYGTVYTYEVRENRTISPTDTSILQHEDDPWLTLLTCKTYIESTDTYANRIAVRAVLIGTAVEKTASGKNAR
jgi:LPXTG-site transpeptidase (sortase) family protein